MIKVLCMVNGCGAVAQGNGFCETHKDRKDFGEFPTPSVTDEINDSLGTMAGTHVFKEEPSAFDHQVGGDHYKKYPIPLATFCHLNKIPKLESDAIYYIVRWRDKNGLADIDKAIHTLQLLKELEQCPTSKS